MGEIKENTFTLPEKKVKVRYIKRRRGMAANVSDDHAISGGMLNTATRKFTAPVQRNGKIANVLTNDEKAHLEDLTRMDLSVYSNEEFWQETQVALFKGDNELDLSDPIDYINYKILLANEDKISPSWEKRNQKLTYQFALIEEGEENQLARKAFNYKKEAFKLYSKIEDSKEVLRGIIKVINKKPISLQTKLRFLQDEVEKIIDENPQKLVSLLRDTDYETKMLLSNAEDAGIVVVQNRRYMTSDGIELAFDGELASFDNAVKYLSDPLNKEIRDLIEVKTRKADK